MPAKPKLTASLRDKILGATSTGVGTDGAGALLGVSGRAIRDLMARDQTFREAMEDARGVANDAVKATIWHLGVTKKNPTMLIWYSKAVMGWSENTRLEVDGTLSLADIIVANAQRRKAREEKREEKRAARRRRPSRKATRKKPTRRKTKRRRSRT